MKHCGIKWNNISVNNFRWYVGRNQVNNFSSFPIGCVRRAKSRFFVDLCIFASFRYFRIYLLVSAVKMIAPSKYALIFYFFECKVLFYLST